jgi:hypothetical protein
MLGGLFDSPGRRAPMAIIRSKDLKYRYSFGPTPSDDNESRAAPDPSSLNRDERYEVLYFIKEFWKTHAKPDKSQPTLAEALHVERLIKEHLPGNVRSHANVTAWLLDGHNWNK